MPVQTKRKPIRVGFDLDGVLLYNPLRLARPFVALAKSLLHISNDQNKFHIPKTPAEQFIWRIPHLLSIFTPKGFEELPEMAKSGDFELYLITARYAYLYPYLKRFIDKKNATEFFKEIIYNKSNEQPHLYKARVIKDLELDYYVEDNWDVVQHLNEQLPDTQTLWMYNLMDRHIVYKHKFSNFKKVLDFVMSKL